jgi:hypothetical protein
MKHFGVRHHEEGINEAVKLFGEKGAEHLYYTLLRILSKKVGKKGSFPARRGRIDQDGTILVKIKLEVLSSLIPQSLPIL